MPLELSNCSCPQVVKIMMNIGGNPRRSGFHMMDTRNKWMRSIDKLVEVLSKRETTTRKEDRF